MKQETRTAESRDCAKVILYVAPHLKGLREASAQSVENQALLSYKRTDALAAADKIAEEIAFGAALAQLRQDVISVLRDLTKEERYLLDYKYFHAQSTECPLFYAERSYYRKQKELLKKFNARMLARGWNADRFFASFGASPFFMRLYAAVREGRESEIVKKRSKKTLMVLQTKSSPSSLRTSGVLREKKTNAATASAAHTAMQTSAI